MTCNESRGLLSSQTLTKSVVTQCHSSFILINQIMIQIIRLLLYELSNY